MIVAGERVGGVDADFAFAETVGGFESQEFDLGAAVFGDVHSFALQLAAVEEQCHIAFRGGSAETSDCRLDLDALGIEDAARGDYVFDGPILFGGADWMEDERGAGCQAQVGEAGGHGGLLHVAHQMDFERHLLAFAERTQVAGEFPVGRAAIAGLDGGYGGAQSAGVIDDLG